ncbi:MAG TPA: nitroreductase family protein [Elusimicrobiota bacterium]|nr:nitroreductase family protein [Elusimicrobiota bacterium]
MSDLSSQVLELMRRRQSVRKYSDRPVEREKLERCFEAARLAPSACNAQPWSFVAVTDREILSRLRENLFNKPYHMCAFAREAPVLVGLIAEPTTFWPTVGGLWRGVKFPLLDLGIAGEHFVLQAAAEGLGTCWLGWFNEREFKSILRLPRKKKVAALLSVGYAEADDPLRDKIRKPIDDIRTCL